MSVMHILLFAAVPLLMLFAGCATEKLPAEDLEVLTACRQEIVTLKSDLSPNSRQKYEAAISLYRKVDFSYIRRVETLDAIFGARDAKVDNPKSVRQVLNFYYQYGNSSIRFVFHRYQNFVFRFEVIEK